jgi:hypothetical protein
MSSSFESSTCSSRATRLTPLAVQCAATSGLGESVSTTIATSSMPRPTIRGSGMPTGMRFMLARSFSCTRRIAASELVPTRKRAVTITLSSRVWE